LIDIIKDKKDFKHIVSALGISAFILSGYAIIQYFTGWGVPVTYSFEGLSRATSIFKYPAALGLYVAPIFVVISSFFIMSWGKDARKKLFKNDLIIIAALAVMGLALIASRAEGAWIGVVMAIFFTFMFTRYRWSALIIILVFALVIMLVPTARDYVFTLITFQDVSGDVRLAIWQGTWNLIKSNPIFGAGLAGFQTLYAQYKEAKHVEISLYPHNIFLNFWVETGIFGLAVVILLIFQYLKKGLTSIKKYHKLQLKSYKISLTAVMICILVYGLVDVPYFKNDLSILFWIWIGLLSFVVARGDDIVKIGK
jgi:O-antigen ligase